MKVIKEHKKCIYIIAPFLLVFFGCNSYDKEIGYELAKMSQHEGVMYDIRDVFKGEWDNIYIFNAESTAEDILYATGILMDEYVSTGEQLFLLEKNGELTQAIKIPSRYFQLIIIEKEDPFVISSKSSMFYVKKRKNINEKITYLIRPN